MNQYEILQEGIDRTLIAVWAVCVMQLITVAVVVFYLWEKRDGDDQYKEGFEDGKEEAAWALNRAAHKDTPAPGLYVNHDS